MKTLRKTLITAAVLARVPAGPVWAGPEPDVMAREVGRLAAVDMDVVTDVRLGRASGPMPHAVAAQEHRVQEYLALHARAVDDGGMLLRWSVPGVRPRVH